MRVYLNRRAVSRTDIGLQSEALVLASVLLPASTAALSGGAGGSAGLCAYHYLGTRLSAAPGCVFSLGRAY